MIELKILGTVNYKDREVLRLSEDVGGMTFIGTWVRTDLLNNYNNYFEKEDEEND